jgi:hypothetical protein
MAMRLYSRTGATALDDPEHGHFEAGPHGGFDLPDDLSDRLHRFHIPGHGPAWETDVERQHRLMSEELERRKDPATLLQAVEQLVAAASATTPPSATPGAATPEATTVTKTRAAKKAAPPA